MLLHLKSADLFWIRESLPFLKFLFHILVSRLWSVCLSVSLSVCLFVCVSVSLFVCLSLATTKSEDMMDADDASTGTRPPTLDVVASTENGALPTPPPIMGSSYASSTNQNQKSAGGDTHPTSSTAVKAATAINATHLASSNALPVNQPSGSALAPGSVLHISVAFFLVLLSANPPPLSPLFNGNNIFVFCMVSFFLAGE